MITSGYPSTVRPGNNGSSSYPVVDLTNVCPAPGKVAMVRSFRVRSRTFVSNSPALGSLYQESGMAAPIRTKQADRGCRGASARIKEAIKGLALQKPPLPIAALYRQVRRLAQDIGEQPPNYWTVYRIVRDLPAGLFILTHKGAKAYSITSSSVVGAKPTVRTWYGKPITRRSISCWFIRTAKSLSRGSRS